MIRLISKDNLDSSRKNCKSVGGKIFSICLPLELFLGVLTAPSEVGNEYISRQFNQKGKEVVEKNINAFLKGYEIGFK
jgi:Pyruvate/2-oxoacid:ferredoxin oxidoreductase gamma subunit